MAITVGFWLNLALAIGFVLLASIIQLFLLKRLRPTPDAAPIPFREALQNIPPDLRRLLSAEIFLRWRDWFVRDFAVLYVVGVLAQSNQQAGLLLALSSLTALLTYIPVGKLVDRSPNPKPFIGLTFLCPLSHQPGAAAPSPASPGGAAHCGPWPGFHPERITGNRRTGP